MRYIKFCANIFVVLVFYTASFAAMKAVDLSQVESWKTFERDTKKTSGEKLLIQLKVFYEEKKFGACLSSVWTAQKKFPSLSPWIRLKEIECAIAGFDAKTTPLKTLIKVVKRLEKRSDFFTGSTEEIFKVRLVDAKIKILKKLLTQNPQKALRTIEWLLERLDWMADEFRAEVFRYAGEVAFIQQKPLSAKGFMLRSLELKEDESVRNRLKAIEAVLNEKGNLGGKRAQKDNNGKGDEKLEATERELELVERMSTAFRTGDIVSAIDDGIRLLEKFPQGIRADWASKRIVESFIGISEKEESKYRLLRQTLLGELKRVEGARLLSWAKVTFRKQLYEESFELASAAVGKLSGRSKMEAHYYTGLAGAYLRKFSAAKNHFSEVVLKSAGKEIAVRALYWLGIVALREEDFQVATAHFERLLALPQSVAFKVRARYWLWRAVQKNRSEKSKRIAQKLIDENSWSYYGLRARLEQPNKPITAPKNVYPLKVKLWLTQGEQQALSNFKLLIAAGWFEEARQELKLIPRVDNADVDYVMATLWAKARGYSVSMRIFERLWEENPAMVTKGSIKLNYPMEFTKTIKNAAKESGVEANLLRAIIRQESSFDPKAKSSAGALGLCQLMPSTAKQVARDLGIGKLLESKGVLDKAINIQLGSGYLKWLLSRFNGNIPAALAAYNVGPTRFGRWVKRRKLDLENSSDPHFELWIDEMPWGETRKYVKRVLRNLLVYRLLDRGRVEFTNPLWVEPKVAVK
jgi:soluble lytic murein transglycosylase